MINRITVDNFAALLNYTPIDRASDSLMARPKEIIIVGWDHSSFVCCLVHRGSTDDLLLQIFCGCLADQGSPTVTQHFVAFESSSLLLHCIKP